jgi:hypothetical protein
MDSYFYTRTQVTERRKRNVVVTNSYMATSCSHLLCLLHTRIRKHKIDTVDPFGYTDVESRSACRCRLFCTIQSNSMEQSPS